MDLQTYLKNFLLFLNDPILPLLIALGGMFFAWNATRYFIIGGANPDDQQKARTLAMWGALAFVLIVSIWGIVGLVADGLGFRTPEPVVPDYIKGGG